MIIYCVPNKPSITSRRHRKVVTKIFFESPRQDHVHKHVNAIVFQTLLSGNLGAGSPGDLWSRPCPMLTLFLVLFAELFIGKRQQVSVTKLQFSFKLFHYNVSENGLMSFSFPSQYYYCPPFSWNHCF